MIDLNRIQHEIQQRTGIWFTLYTWSKRPDADAWGVITMDGQTAAVWGGDQMRDQALEGSVHLFIRSTDTTVPDAVQSALGELRLSWRLDACVYEPDTRYLHYTWIWRDWGRLQ